MDPFAGVYEILEGLYQLERLVLGLPVLLVGVGLIRLFLWALLLPVCGRTADLVANTLMACAVFLVIAGGHGAAVAGWAADVAGRFLGGLGFSHSSGTIAELRWYLDQAAWQLQRVF